MANLPALFPGTSVLVYNTPDLVICTEKTVLTLSTLVPSTAVMVSTCEMGVTSRIQLLQITLVPTIVIVPPFTGGIVPVAGYAAPIPVPLPDAIPLSAYMASLFPCAAPLSSHTLVSTSIVPRMPTSSHPPCSMKRCYRHCHDPRRRNPPPCILKGKYCPQTRSSLGTLMLGAGPVAGFWPQGH